MSGDLSVGGRRDGRADLDVVDHRVYEIEWELLERCPECGAYDWEPEPVKVPAPFREAADA